MFTPVGGRQKILSSDPPVSPPFPSLSGNWRRSCCHFNASGVFSPPTHPPQGRVTHPRRPPSPICLCLRVCGEEKQKNKQKCANAVHKIPVCMCKSVGLLCLCHVTYVKRCLCASRRHLRALWESRRLYDFSFLLRCTHLYYTHTCVAAAICFHLLLRSVKKRERERYKKKSLGPWVSTSALSPALKLLSLGEASWDSDPASRASTDGFNSLNNLLMHVNRCPKIRRACLCGVWARVRVCIRHCCCFFFLFFFVLFLLLSGFLAKDELRFPLSGCMRLEG